MATVLTLPYVFVDGQILPASQLNANFQTLYNDYNGSIVNANISPTASISLSKLASGLALNLQSAGNPAWAAGITGDTNPRIVLYSDGFLKFGAGGASAVDIMLKRLDANTIAARDAGDTADRDLLARSVVLRNTNKVTFTPGAIAADRAITVNDPGAAANLPLSTNAGTAGQVFVANGTGANGSFQDASTVSTEFGGNGSEGAITLTAGITDPPKMRNGTTVVIGNGTQGPMEGGIHVNATSTITWQGIGAFLVVDGSGYSGAPALATASKSAMRGGGPMGGDGGATSTIGGGAGGGGAGGAKGGAGGASVAGAVNEGNPINSVVGVGEGNAGLLGSGGGGGATGAGGSTAAAGTGAGFIRMCARGAITLPGVSGGGALQADGTAGGAGTTLAGGCGGGGGGSIWLYSATSISTGGGTITADGAAGGNGAGAGGDGGGGGGGGFVLRMSPSNGAITVTANGGAAGTGTIAGTAGSNGSDVSITGTPCLPLIAYHADGRGLFTQVAILKARRFLANQDMVHLNMTHRENATYLAAWYATQGEFDNLCWALMHGGGEETSKYACVDVRNAFETCGVKGEAPVDIRPSTAIGDFGILKDAA